MRLNAASSSVTGQVFRKLQCPQCSKTFRMQAALDHHLVTTHTGAPDTEPRKERNKQMTFEAPRFLGTAMNRIEIVGMRPMKEEIDPNIYNPFAAKNVANIPRTSANSVVSDLGPSTLPVKRCDNSDTSFSNAAGTWVSQPRDAQSTQSASGFPDMDAVLEMDPFAEPGTRPPKPPEQKIPERSIPQSEIKSTVEPVINTEEEKPVVNTPNSVIQAINAKIVMPTCHFVCIDGDEVTNPFAPQPDGIGAYNYFAAQLNKKLAIEGMNTVTKQKEAGGNTQFTPFTSQGAFPEAPRVPLTQSFVPLAFGSRPEKMSSAVQTMNDSVVSFIQGNTSDFVQSASPFKHGMHHQLELPNSPYAPDAPSRITQIITSEEPAQTSVETQTVDEDIITFVGPKEPTRIACPKCPKVFYIVDGLIEHMTKKHGINISKDDALEISRRPRGAPLESNNIRRGVKPGVEVPDTSSVLDDMQTEYLRKEFTAKLTPKTSRADANAPQVYSEDTFIAAHLSVANSIALTGTASNIEDGQIAGEKFIRFTVTVPFEAPPAGEPSADVFTVLYDCTPRKQQVVIPGPLNEEVKESAARLRQKTVVSRRQTILQEQKARQVNEMESYLRRVVKEDALVYVSGHFRMNPQLTLNGRQYFPVILVTPYTGHVATIGGSLK